MSENSGLDIGNREQLFVSQEKILLPEVFDQQFLKGEIPLEEIQAVTMMTLSQFKSDASLNEMDQEQWIRYFPKEIRYEAKGVWPFKKNHKIEYIDKKIMLDQIQDNREYFKWPMGMRSALAQFYPEAAKRIYGGKYADVLYTNREYSDESPITNFEELTQLIIKAHTYPSFKMTESEAKAPADLMIDSLGSYEALNRMLTESKNHQGVQVIYGANFLDHSHLRSTGDMMDSKLFPSRIHPRHITAVLPVGKYEQEQLLGKTY